MEPRIKPVESPYEEGVAKDFSVIMPNGLEPLKLFKTVANNPRVLNRMISGGLLDKGSISISDRELVILRACARTGAEYEWGVHVVGFASKAGFTEEQIEHTCRHTVDPAIWSDAQQALIALVDQLHTDNKVSDTLWDELCRHYKSDQLVELVMLAGLYQAVSYVVNAFRIEREVYAPVFPNSRDL